MPMNLFIGEVTKFLSYLASDEIFSVANAWGFTKIDLSLYALKRDDIATKKFT